MNEQSVTSAEFSTTRNLPVPEREEDDDEEEIVMKERTRCEGEDAVMKWS